MKVVGCMLFYHIGVVFLLLTCISLGIHKSILVSGDIDVVTITSTTTSSINRQLKDNIDDSINDKGLYDGAVSLDDYRPYDPSPSSKASVRGAPIEHGTPLMPYIPSPKPSPPNHSDQDDPSPGPSVSS